MARFASPPSSRRFSTMPALFIHVDLEAAKHKIGAAQVANAPKFARC